ncbi:DUF3100 domain-containing protein [Streptosporangium saharense]|uniref:DUF3100 domain-containing protein n=1 Tax=Streptosporangium saharense TaxID=1706840 RepID=UPI0034324E6A
MSRRTPVLLLAGAALISVVAEMIGTRHLQLGPGQVILFPIVWAIVIGGLVSFQRFRPLSSETQQSALGLVSVGIMVFLVLVGITVGASLDSLKDVTWVLALQEIFHLFGTVIVALPVAVAIRMGRSSIGATYSIDREANLAYTAERYGPSSPEYRGTIGVYVFGSVFGALYLAVLAGYFSSAGWLDPLALAMGSGVGSGSMMAAAAAAIASAYPELSDQILAHAAASNLMTQTIGTYVTCFVALPLAERLYPLWCRVFRTAERLEGDGPSTAPASRTGDRSRQVSGTTEDAEGPVTAQVVQERESSARNGSDGLRRLPVTLFAFVVLMTLSNTVSTGKLTVQTVGGVLMLAVVTFGAFVVNRYVPKIPVLLVTTLVGIIIAAPFSPISDQVRELTSGISFLSLVTPVLALVGLSLGKERLALKRLSWRVVVVALVSFSASFLAAAFVANPFVQ